VNEFRVTGTVTHIARAGQFATEARRKWHEEARGTVGVPDEWREPSRFGIHQRAGKSERYTTLRIELDGDRGLSWDAWVDETDAGKTTFERVLKLEPGDRVSITGELGRVYGPFQVGPRARRVKLLTRAEETDG